MGRLAHVFHDDRMYNGFPARDIGPDCADDGAYEFFTAAPPIKFTRAVGSPINPLAVK